jgi:hypothetical protein
MANRTLICTVAALSAGICGFWAGGQLNLAVERQACEARSWGFDAACKMIVAPGALWKGSTTGLWVGTILGAFLAGTLTHRPTQKDDASDAAVTETNRKLDFTALKAADVEITPPQDEALRCLLILTAVQAGATSSLPRQPQLESLTDAQQMLSPLGFSPNAIAQAWHMFQANQNDA